MPTLIGASLSEFSTGYPPRGCSSLSSDASTPTFLKLPFASVFT